MSMDLATTNPRLALVRDATNIDCLVTYVDGAAPERVRYAERLQEAGVVIRNCHVVLVDHEPAQIAWRVGTIARVERLDGGIATYNDGCRAPRTAPFKDKRPAEEQREAPIAVGDTVLLQGSGEPAVVDTVVDGRIAHPDRLYARVIAALRAREQRQ